MKALENDILDILSESGLDYIRREDNKKLWQDAYNLLEYQSTEYLSSRIDLLNEFNKGNYDELVDISLIFIVSGKPAGLWPLTLSQNSNSKYLSSQCSHILSPILIPDCSPKIVKKIQSCCLNIVNKICEKYNQDNWSSLTPFINTSFVNSWHLACLAKGASSRSQYNMYIDLSKDISFIKSNYRKSYKSLISKSKKLWNVRIHGSSIDENIWKEFINLHKHVSGRVTRSKKTWEIQHKDLLNNSAILISIHKECEEMVGAALITFSMHEARYDVGAYNRDLFDKPIGHIAQHTAIEELKKRNIKFYKIGRKYLQSDLPKPSSKEISISHFKEGFASFIAPEFIQDNKIKKSIY